MSRLKSNDAQIHISLPTEWKLQLENFARIYSVEEGYSGIYTRRKGAQEK